MSVDIAVVPVAGAGTRMLPLTKSQPKEMLSIARKTVVQYVVEELANSGIKKLLFVTGRGKNAIENHFDPDVNLVNSLRMAGKEELLQELDFERLPMEYFYTRQHTPLGLGHAVLCSRSFVGDQSFSLALGDSILGLHGTSTAMARMKSVFEEEQADAVLAFEEVSLENVHRYGIAAPKKQSGDIIELEDMVEKPCGEKAPSRFAASARYIFKPRIFEYLQNTKPGKGGEIQLTDAISALCRDGGKVLGVVLPPVDRRFDIGNFDSYYRTFVEFALSDPEYGPSLRSFVKELVGEGEEPSCS